MAHVMKFTKASCGHMFAHFDRKAEHISNENLTGRGHTSTTISPPIRRWIRASLYARGVPKSIAKTEKM